MRRLLCVLCLFPAPPAAALGLHYEGGLSITSGDYVFSERTTSISWLNGLSLDRGRATLRASAPVWFQSSELVSVTGAGPLPSGGQRYGEAVRDSGMSSRGSGRRIPVGSDGTTDFRAVLGDPTIQLSLGVIDRLDTSIHASLSAKVPAASSGDFGTGEWDLGGALSFARIMGTRWLGALDLSYWRLGDLPTLQLRNPIGLHASVTRLAGNWAIIVSGSASSAILRGYDPPVAVGAGITRRVGAGSWGSQFTLGLTDTAADIGAGIQWRVPLPGR